MSQFSLVSTQNTLRTSGEESYDQDFAPEYEEARYPLRKCIWGTRPTAAYLVDKGIKVICEKVIFANCHA